MTLKKAYIIGTFDTKAAELNFVRQCLQKQGIPTISLDVGTLKSSRVFDVQPEVSPEDIFPKVFENTFSSRGEALSAMGQKLSEYLSEQKDIGGVISLGGSGGTSLVSKALRELPVGLPKIMVSTMASGDIRPYIGSNDIYMVYSITDIKGINRLSNTILSNAAHALGGMIKNNPPLYENSLESIGITMFGVTTTCVDAVVSELAGSYEPLVFHATGVGGQSMEKLIDSGHIKYAMDITTTEVADHLMGGVLTAGADRMGAVIRQKIPYVGSVGALDMVNFGEKQTVPKKYANRNLYVHNEQVTLMRTTTEENILMGKWIAEKLNQMQGEVRFLLPEKGVSALSIEGGAFFDSEADQALFDTLKQEVKTTSKRQLIHLPYAINDKEFSKALVDNLLMIINKK